MLHTLANSNESETINLLKRGVEVSVELFDLSLNGGWRIPIQMFNILRSQSLRMAILDQGVAEGHLLGELRQNCTSCSATYHVDAGRRPLGWARKCCQIKDLEIFKKWIEQVRFCSQDVIVVLFDVYFLISSSDWSSVIVCNASTIST